MLFDIPILRQIRQGQSIPQADFKFIFSRNTENKLQFFPCLTLIIHHIQLGRLFLEYTEMQITGPKSHILGRHQTVRSGRVTPHNTLYNFNRICFFHQHKPGPYHRIQKSKHFRLRSVSVIAVIILYGNNTVSRIP